MNRYESKDNGRCRLPLAALAVFFLFCSIVAISGGCGNAIWRGQSPDGSFAKFRQSESETKFIGSVCGVNGLNPAQIEGIGLVVGLEGTGSEPSPSGQRDYLLKELRANSSVKDAKAALASPNTSMVVLRGLIPAGAKKGDRMDMEVMTLPKSDTTSLKHGELLPTDLRPMAFLSRSVKLGNVMGKAKGRVLVDSLFDDSGNEQSLLHGVIPGGGIVGADRELTLVVHSEETSVKVTRSIAHSINQRYNTITANGRENSATPVTDRVIELRVPDEYQFNLGRFIQSLQAMSFGESIDDRVDRIDELDRRISDPESAQRAAIELEAIGAEGIPSLERALKHSDFEVRFLASEALAYQGRTDGIEHLKLAAESEPAFRWHALTALASIDDPSARTALIDLFDVQSAETRYGAFRALQNCSPDDRRIAGILLANDFQFHEIPTQGPGLIHFSRTHQPEVVVFGDGNRIADDFLYVEAGMTVKAAGNGRVQITRFGLDDEKQQASCSTEIPDLIRTLTRFGFGFTTILDLCREADASGTLGSRLVINAAPRIGSKSIKDSARGGDDSKERSERYISTTSVPEMFTDVQSASDEEPKSR